MVSYYYVESESGGKNNKSYVISNAQDRRTVSEEELAKAIKENRVVLTNYALASTGSMKIIKLRTNQIIPQEKMFQASTVNKLLGGFMVGKQIVNDHANLIISLTNRERDAAVNKFIGRLIDAIRMYISYMDKVDVKVVIKHENKSILLYKHVDQILSDYVINRIGLISNQEGLSTEFNKFKSKYTTSFVSYDFLLILLHKIVEQDKYKEDVKTILKLLMAVIKMSKYTFIGEQMDKQFCNDLLKQYNESVLNNSAIDLHRLTQAERQAKADEGCQPFRTGYLAFTNKLNNDRNTIIHSIRNGGRHAEELLDTLEKLDSSDYARLQLVSGKDRTGNYEKFLLEKAEETKILTMKIRECFKSRSTSKAIKALSTAVDLSSDALLSSVSPVGIGTGTIMKCVNSCIETDKLADELIQHSIENNLPNDIAKIIKRLNKTDLFTVNMILYQYEKYMYMKVKETEFKKGAYSVLEVWFNIDASFKKLRDKKYKDIDKYMLARYNGSYIQALSDILTIDSNHVLDRLYDLTTKDDMMASDRVKTDNIYLEKAWIPAYRILCNYIDTSYLYNIQMEQAIFWKVFEDMYEALKLVRVDEFRNEKMAKYMKVFNETYGTKFIRANDSKINILKITKDTSE